MPELQAGMPAPQFTLPDQNGEPRSLSDFAGHWVLLYFYPRDDTPGCTKEACGLRDELPTLTELDAVVLGVSTDSVKSHAKFATKYGLPFTLLADEDHKVVEAYEARGKKKFMGRTLFGTLRKSYLIDPRGRIAKIYPKVKPAEHAAQVVRDIRAAKG